MWNNNSNLATSSISDTIYRFRLPILLVSFVYLAFVITMALLRPVPYFVAGWSGVQLEILEILEAPTQLPVQVGDEIVQIDGRKVQRLDNIFSVRKESDASCLYLVWGCHGRLIS